MLLCVPALLSRIRFAMAVNAITTTTRGYYYDDDYYYYDDDDYYYNNDDDAVHAYYGFSSPTTLGLLSLPPALCLVALLVGAIAGFIACARWKPTWGVAISGGAGLPSTVQVNTAEQPRTADVFATNEVCTVIVSGTFPIVKVISPVFRSKTTVYELKLLMAASTML